MEEDSVKIFVKIIFLVIILEVSLFFSYFPFVWNFKKKFNNMLASLNSLNGGVFIGIGLFMILPSANKSF